MGGEMQYSLDGENYSVELPIATEAGIYTVYYKVVGDANHTDTEAETIIVTVSKDTEGIDHVQSDHVPCTKVLIDGQLYILRGEKIYTTTGLEAK